MEIIIPIVVVILIVVGIVSASSRPSISKFQQLGDIRGKTLAEVIEVGGLPQSYSNSGPWKVLAQWINPGFHMALLFEYRGPKDADWGNIDAHRHEFICLGVTHQYGG